MFIIEHFLLLTTSLHFSEHLYQYTNTPPQLIIVIKEETYTNVTVTSQIS